MIDAKVQDAKRAIPGINEVRQLLFAALFLADELNDVKATAESAKTPAPAPPTSDPRLADALESLADRMESLAARLAVLRSEEHTSELQSLMRISYAVFCLKKKISTSKKNYTRKRHYKHHKQKPHKRTT